MGALAAWCAAPVTPSHGRVVDTSLTIGNGWAVVRETREMDLSAGRQELILEDIPEAADLSTLVISTRRVPVRLISWERDRLAQGRTAALSDDPGWVLDGADVVWRRAAALPPAATSHDTAAPVRCVIDFPVAGKRALDVGYLVPGFRWSSQYQVLIRGDLDDDEEMVSLDLFGTIRIQNVSARTYEQAHVRLVGSDTKEALPWRHSPGILMIEEGPMARLWQRPEPEPGIEHLYRLPHRVRLAPLEETEVHFLSAIRIPATRLFVLNADDVPFTTVGLSAPLRKYVTFRNTEQYGLGWVMPPGPVEVFHGGLRRYLLQEARLPHTPLNREIRIDFGTDDQVLGTRRRMARTAPENGRYEELFEITLDNRRAGPVHIELDERPHLTLDWDVMRANESYEIMGNRLVFNPRVSGLTERRIQYRLRFHQPTL